MMNMTPENPTSTPTRSSCTGTQRRGQMESGEMLIVIIVVVFLLLLAVFFFFRLSSRGLDESAAARGETEGTLLAKRAVNLPMVACDENGKTLQGCIDRLKIRAFAAAQQDGATLSFAHSLFGPAAISLVVLSCPQPGATVIYTYPSEGFDTSSFFYPVLVYDPLPRQYCFGYLNITIYTVKR